MLNTVTFIICVANDQFTQMLFAGHDRCLVVASLPRPQDYWRNCSYLCQPERPITFLGVIPPLGYPHVVPLPPWLGTPVFAWPLPAEPRKVRRRATERRAHWGRKMETDRGNQRGTEEPWAKEMGIDRRQEGRGGCETFWEEVAELIQRDINRVRGRLRMWWLRMVACSRCWQEDAPPKWGVWLPLFPPLQTRGERLVMIDSPGMRV